MIVSECVLLPLIITFAVFQSIKGEAFHYQKVSLSSAAQFNVTKTTKGIKKAQCSIKCTSKWNQCNAFAYDQDTQTCTLGEIHPADAICDGQFKNVSIRSEVFDPEYVLQFATFHPQVSYYSLDQNYVEPVDVIPTSMPWSTNQIFGATMKYYTNEAFYVCPITTGENCHKWDTNTHEWIDLKGKPATKHYQGAIVTFEDGKVALMAGLDTWNGVQQAGNDLMNADETFTPLVPFDAAQTNSGGCAISETQLIVVGGWTTSTLKTSWLFDVIANTKTRLRNMIHYRNHPACAKINSNEVILLGEWSGNMHVESYNIATNSWHARPEYYLPAKMGYPRLVYWQGRLIVLGGFNVDESGSHKIVWEWNKKNGWFKHDNELAIFTYDLNGNIIPFFRKYQKPKC